MIWLMKLCFLAEVALVIQQRDVYASNITWEPTKIPLVFGKDVGIRCTYHNTLSCNDPITWTWYIGTDNDLILTNGTLTDKFKSEHKYSEITSNCLQISTLIVSNFNERDYNQTYKCGIANHKQSGHLFAENIKNKITFENTSYEYIPSDEMISTEIKLKNQQISCRVEIPKVYPFPDFKATFEDEDITNGLKIQKKKTNLFYYVSINLTLQNKSVASVGNICIKCKRRGSWWYLTNSWNPNCTKTWTIDESDYPIAVLINVYSMSYVVSSMVVILVFFSRRDKFAVIIKILYLIDFIHVYLGFGIISGYVIALATTKEGGLRLKAGHEFIFYIFRHSGGVKLITIAIVVVIAMKTYRKIKNKQMNAYVALSINLPALFSTVLILTVLLSKTEQRDANIELDLIVFQIFLGIKLFCSCLLMSITEDHLLDKLRELLALLVDSGYDDVSSSRSDKYAFPVYSGHDDESYRSTETHVPLMDKEYDVESFGSSAHVPLVDKAYDVESFGSSDSYNTADESPNNEEMFTAQTVF